MTPKPATSEPAGPEEGADLGLFVASDGARLQYRHWRVAATPRGCVVALHGIQSHSGWYAHSSRCLAQSRFDVRFLDRRGSGLNARAGSREVTHVRLLADVAEFLSAVRSELAAERGPPVPVVLLGLSWGARLAVVTAAAHPDLLDALVLLYPGILVQCGPGRIRHWLAAVLSRLGGGGWTVRIPLQPEQFTSDLQWQRFIREDPCALREVSLRFLMASERLRSEALRAPSRITCPCLMMLAEEDDIVDVPATRAYAAQFASRQRQVLSYTARHTLEFEPCRDQFVANLTEWIESHVAVDPRTSET